MRIVTEKELLELDNKEKAKILKEICEGKIKYIGGNKNDNN